MSLQTLREKNHMSIHELSEAAFSVYGRAVSGMDFSGVLAWLLQHVPMPESGVTYVPGVAALEALPEKARMQDILFGGLEMQLGVCCGFNQALNALEYHRSSEFIIAATDLVLLLGKQQDIVGDTYETNRVEAFFMPAGVCVELFATTLHYAPISTDSAGFRAAIALHRGTNMDAPPQPQGEGRLLMAKNKWLIGHENDASLRGGRAHIGLKGENIHIAY